MDIKQFLIFGIQNQASDIHLAAQVPPALRINGTLQFLELPPLTSDETKLLFYQIMSKEQQEDFEAKGEIDLSLAIENLGRFRVNIFKQNRGFSGVFRIIPDRNYSLKELGAPSVFEKIAFMRQGLVLVTGPTGSGKSSTLATLIDFINQNKSCHIVTLEDPIEFIHQNKKSLISQRQVYRDTENFTTALRAVLREDPDVILLGEMRDLETIRLALSAAETGHLVLASVHTNSAAKTINRIIDVFPGNEKAMVRLLLSESLQAVICQDLLKNTLGGRTAVFEILLCTPAIRNLIREDKVAQMVSVIQTSAALGMQTMESHIHHLIRQGVISSEVAQGFGD